MSILIVAKPEIATAEIKQNVVHVASRSRAEIPDAKPAHINCSNEESGQLVNSLHKEMTRMLDLEDCDSFLFE